jgi:Ca2+-transporting ATPase
VYWTNRSIDPACSLFFEAEQAEADIMRRPPRRRDVGLLSRETLSIAVLQGFSILAVCLGVFLLARRDHSDDAARALTFVTLVVAFVVVILVNRSWMRSAVAMVRAPNPAVRWVLLAGPARPGRDPLGAGLVIDVPGELRASGSRRVRRVGAY